MRAIDKALAALALRAAPAGPPKAERRPAPAIDEPDPALADRAAISQQRAALIASLWPPPTLQCVAAPLYLELPAPAVFGVVFRVSWPAAPVGDARALQARLGDVFAPGHTAQAEALAA